MFRLVDGKAFPALEILRIALCETGFALLTPRVNSLADLKLKILGSSSEVLRIAANLPHLRQLEIIIGDFGHEGGFVIRGDDLICFASGCRRLEVIEIADGTANSVVRAESITDTTIEHFARRLPNLQKLSMEIENAELTELSLLALGKHCKKLELCRLLASVSFQELVGRSQPGFFPALHRLRPHGLDFVKIAGPATT